MNFFFFRRGLWYFYFPIEILTQKYSVRISNANSYFYEWVYDAKQMARPCSTSSADSARYVPLILFFQLQRTVNRHMFESPSATLHLQAIGARVPVYWAFRHILFHVGPGHCPVHGFGNGCSLGLSQVEGTGQCTAHHSGFSAFAAESCNP